MCLAASKELRRGEEQAAALRPGDGVDSCTYLHVHPLPSLRGMPLSFIASFPKRLLTAPARRRRVDSRIFPLSAVLRIPYPTVLAPLPRHLLSPSFFFSTSVSSNGIQQRRDERRLPISPSDNFDSLRQLRISSSIYFYANFARACV